MIPLWATLIIPFVGAFLGARYRKGWGIGASILFAMASFVILAVLFAAALLFATSGRSAAALVLVPYEPSRDCVPSKPMSVVVYLYVTSDDGLRWNGESITRSQLESYLRQERARLPEKRDGFRVYRDNASAKEAAKIVQELKDVGIPFAKPCPLIE